MTFLADLLQAIYSTLQDWADGIASWNRFLAALLFIIAISAIFGFFW